MKTGTPGFVGARLREAREARGITAASLSELSGVSPQAISQYENGACSPNSKTLETMASALNMPLPFFTAPSRSLEGDTIFFRSMSAATIRARTSAKWKVKWLIDIAMHIGQFISSPAANLPDLGLPTDPLLISDDDIENAAQDARRYWGMGDSPIGNMILLLENQGVFTARLELGAESLDSLSMLDPEDGRPYIILGTDKGTAVRWRFDAAHELGHLLLHQHVNKRILARTADFKRIEEQAHRFAAAFLLPMEPFCEDLFAVSLDAMRAMKPRWKVSIALMIMRARQAGFLSEEAEKRLWTNLSRRQWRRQEPYDLEMPAEEPRLLRRATEMLLSSGMQTIEDLTANTQLSSADIERLVGFPLGYLTNDFTPINIIQRQPINTPSQSGASARVIQLKSRKNETDHNA